MLSEKLESMQMYEHQPGSAATGNGGLDTADTTLIESVRPSSFVAAGDRLPARLNSSKKYCMFWRNWDIHRKL